MRVTTSMYYGNLEAQHNKLSKELFDVNKQISSGLQIQYAYENTQTFAETMRLDDEVTTLEQVKSSATSGLKFSMQTDTTLNDMTKILETIKVKLVQAANDAAHSPESLSAIRGDLEGLRNNMLMLSNTSINGQYLFAGTATSDKPVNSDGSYNGNDGDLLAFIGDSVQQRYNVSGAELFFGEERGTERKITTNVPGYNHSLTHPDIMDKSDNPDNVNNTTHLLETDRIRDMVGDIHSQQDIDEGIETYATTYFYVRGTQHDGTAFKQKIAMTGDEQVDVLLDKIGEAYGNTPTNTVVNVTLNAKGQIEIEDKLSGSSKLDFHMVAATDFNLLDGDDADIANGTDSIDDLDVGETSLQKVFDGTSTAANPDLLITEFVKSDYLSTDGTNTIGALNIDGLNYDRVFFQKEGATLSSNVSQVTVDDNAYVNETTTLHDAVFSASDTTGTLDGKSFNLVGKDVNGVDYDVTIHLNSYVPPAATLTDGVYFTDNLTGTDYPVYDAAFNDLDASGSKDAGEGIVTQADGMTYRQLMDVTNMVVTGFLPADDVANDPVTYDQQLVNARGRAEVHLDNKGRIVFEELGKTSTLATLSLFDTTASDFTDTNPADDPNVDTASVMTFHANNSLMIRDPKTDFFAVLDEAIEAVRFGKFSADATSSGDPRNSGIQNSMRMVDDLLNHVVTQHAKAGVNSQALQFTMERSETLIISTSTLRSEIIDTDIAEASMRLQQVSINFQAMLSTVSRISQLSLVNYL